MKKTIYRFFVDDTKEEAWLNDMSAQGWHFQKVQVRFYTFVKDDNQKYIYRTELLIEKTMKEQKEYVEFLEDSGITVIQKHGAWVYTRKEANVGTYELFTDHSSRMLYTKKVLKFSISMLFPMIILSVVNFINATRDSSFSYVSLICGIICTVAAIMFACSAFQLYQRKKSLEKRRQLFE